MKRLARFLGIVLLIGLTLASGIIHGRMSRRWGVSQESLAMGGKLERIPKQLGDWELTSSEKMSDVVVNELQCWGHIVRTYKNKETGSTVNVAVIVGPQGPTSVHTAEICYSSRDYVIPEDKERVTLPGPQGSNDVFWALTLESRALETPNPLRVYYAWSTGDRWSAPTNARTWFLGKPFLYKVQVAGSLPPAFNPDGSDSAMETAEDDPCREFLLVFVPAARNCLDKGLAD